MDQILTFDKSYQQRFQEYMDVLSGYEVLTASQVKKEFGFYLEMVIDANGWQAVWKIPRKTCEILKILYPAIVLVYVDNIDFRDLNAFVKILAVQDDIHLAETHNVPLTQLWPTKYQDDTVGLNLEATGNGIDMLHFFYNHLWRPWDVDDDENVDWLSKHLEIRLRLHYDIKMGVIPRVTAEHLRSLLTEAKTIQSKREQLEEALEDQDIDIDYSPENSKPNVKEPVQTLMNLLIRMTQIKSEVEILENPVLRAVLLNKKQSQLGESPDEIQQKWLIFPSSHSVDEYIDFLTEVKDSYPPETTFKSSTTLQSALENASPKDSIIVFPGQHNVNSVCALEEGGVIKSLEKNNTRTELISTNENIMLDFSGEMVLLENLCINSNFSQCCLLVRKGKVKMENCSLVGKGESSIHQGIIVLPEAELHMENCSISGYATAIVANSKSNINLQNVDISEVEIGVKIFDKSHINLHQCSFTNCKQYGLYVEKDEDMEEAMTGGLDILDNLSDVNAADCTFSSNGKYDVIINKVQRIMPVRDLFSNPKFETTLNGSITNVDSDLQSDEDERLENSEDMEI